MKARQAPRSRDETRRSNPTPSDTLATLLQRRLSRRSFLHCSAAGLAAGWQPFTPLLAAAASRFRFAEIQHGVDPHHHVAPGYRAEVLLRWGEPLFSDAPPFDPHRQSAAAQRRQFGYNNDFVAFLPLPQGSRNSDRGLLTVNHESSNARLMFAADSPLSAAERQAIEMAAHGLSVVEISRRGGHWQLHRASRYNRRISPDVSWLALSGPAAGHRLLRTGADPSGRRVLGTLGNCAGGVTPWGTVLSAEENFDNYFSGAIESHPQRAALRRYGVAGNRRGWGGLLARFDPAREPQESNRFGWIVELDPYDPTSTPVKRTALGRFKHEGAGCVLNRDGRVVVYSGDDERFEYLYRFVSAGRFTPDNPAANRQLLDRGTLYVARFNDDGSLAWLPLLHSLGPLTAENGFADQGEVLIHARLAADRLGATPMDRPEDIEANPHTGRVYLMLTNNKARRPEQRDAANPRAENRFGHILELLPPDGDHAADRFRWEVLVRCGDPARPELDARWNPATSRHGWFASPDNCAIDHQGRLWVASDQGTGWYRTGTADGLWGLETEGPLRGSGRMFFRVPLGAELCGPCFTPDDRSLFLAIQHPGSDGTDRYPPFGRRASFSDPATRWPDFDATMPPRPSVVVISKDDGGRVGG